MPQIPLYSHQPQASGQVNVRVNPGILNGQYEAAQRVGAAVADIGNSVAKFQLQKQEAADYATLTDVDRRMKESFLLYQDELRKQPDEKKWLPDWEQRAAKLEAEVMKDVPATIKPRLKAEVDGWKSITSAQVRGAVTAREIEKGRAQVVDAVDMDLKLGDVDSAVAKIRGGAERGLFSPEEATKLERQTEQKADYYAAFAQVNENPAQAIEVLQERTEGGNPKNFKALDEAQRYSLIQSARGAWNSQKIETLNGLYERQLAGEVIPEAEVMGLVDRKLLGAGTAKSFLKEQAKSQGGTAGNATAFADVLVKIGDYNPLRDTGRVQYADLMAQAMTLPDAMKTDAVARLREAADPEAPKNTPAGQAAMKMIDEAFKAGLYGQFEREERTAAGMAKVVDNKAWSQAVQTKAQIQDGVADFLKRKPNATREEVTNEVIRLNQGYVDATARSALNGGRDPLGLMLKQQSQDKALESRLVDLVNKYSPKND